jgi:hypothetical protein
MKELGSSKSEGNESKLYTCVRKGKDPTVQYIRGLHCFKLNGNPTENYTCRYWQKINFLLFAKCLKMYSFFSHLHLKSSKSANMTKKKLS